MTIHATDAELNDVVDVPYGHENPHIHKHVAQCAECQREVASIRALIDRSAGLNDPIAPPSDLWPAIAQAAPLVQRRLQRNRLSRLIPFAAAVTFTAAGASLGYFVADARHTTRSAQQAADSTIQATITSTMPDAPLLRRAAAAVGDSALYEERLKTLVELLTSRDRAAIAVSPTLAVRRHEIERLTKRVTVNGQNESLVNELDRALDAWYFDVQQLRREGERR